MKQWWITGMTGVGKTTVGKLLAARLNINFVDTDSEIVQRACCAISDIFAQRGEHGFRDIEAKVIADLVESDSTVIALGAGALEREENRERIQSSGIMIYLRTTMDVLVQRKFAADRPLLSSAHNPTELRQKLSRMLEQREPNYLKADIIVDVSEQDSPEAIVERILKTDEFLQL